MHKLILTLGLLASCSAAPARPELRHPPTGPLAARELRAPLRVTDLAGQAIDLDADLRDGRPVALVFWQTWCASCLAEAPELAEAARRWGQEIRFIGVVPGPDDVVDEADLAELVAKYGLPYPQVRDRDLALTRRFAIQGTPTILVLGAGEQTLYRGARPPTDWSALLSPR